ncbi:hypothetical protein XI03_20830 [Bradyrhizobium sp. CCBAU 65884]|uniref:TauD/TfdA dioxygenase family protein n=1 Tax=Bradyrhizobium sp. CCBAU 65884 TaxID=722477 RepID=UPI00230593F6|nr:TauD/TfdA family dioxygenase [Bradyrhizobium sp. CCBAU 65884]MDA9476886.1 hypothetical protein [Bradyrhizobium sp. CCBAU 65884]
MRNTKIVDAFIPRTNVVRRAPRLGAEIVNVKLSSEMSQDVLCAIRQVLHERQVIFFRDQTHLDEAEQDRLVAMLGNVGSQPSLAPSVPLATVAYASCDHRSANIIHHVDSGLCLLRSGTIAPGSHETAWSNMRAAYLDLPLPLRKLADELWAIHRDEPADGLQSGDAEANTKFPNEQLAQRGFEVDHPVVRIHPLTGERFLAIGNVVDRFVGLQKDTGQKLFHLLHSYITAPQNSLRWSWRAGDVAIWDSRAAHYYTIQDMQRGTRDNLARDLPVSVNGHRDGKRSMLPKPHAARAA